MSRKAFHHLLKRYLAGKCNEQERKIVEQWYGMLDDDDLQDLQAAELSAIDEKLWNTITAKVGEQKTPNERTKSLKPDRPWKKLAVAASLIGILAIALYWAGTKENTTAEFLSLAETDQITEANHTAQSRKLQLEDGSVVELKPGAALRYPKSFTEKKREVFITGEALFNVSKDPSRPFYVFSDNLITQVVGTSFIVKTSGANHRSEVTVLTGKVIVSRNEYQRNLYHDLFNGRESKVELTMNQMVTYHQNTKDLIVSLVKVPLPITSHGINEGSNFIFNDTPLSQVLNDIETTYGIEIFMENTALNHCTFTGDIKDQDLYSKLEIICQSVGANYKIEGTKIRLQGGKC
ncbi:MAG: FecR family protein [Bacteroidota bacterium]